MRYLMILFLFCTTTQGQEVLFFNWEGVVTESAVPQVAVNTPVRGDVFYDLALATYDTDRAADPQIGIWSLFPPSSMSLYLSDDVVLVASDETSEFVVLTSNTDGFEGDALDYRLSSMEADGLDLQNQFLYLSFFDAEGEALFWENAPTSAPDLADWDTATFRVGGFFPWEDNQFSGVITRVEGSIPGDFNDDRVVDALDYVHWRDNIGRQEPLRNDGGLFLPIGADHYRLWRDADQESSTSATAVPEPRVWGLLSASIALFLILGVVRKK